jgi:N-acetylglucosaminyldiphosphoundecaprenol N-acetyl-beta-D-mannosaminyltransferase
MSRTQVNLLGVWVDPVTKEDCIRSIIFWAKKKGRQYIVTPNLDHCRLVSMNQDLATVYERAGLVLPDGWPLVAASRLTKLPIKRRVTGADLVVPLCQALAANNLSVFLLGTSPEVLEESSRKLKEKAPGLIVKGTHSPPFGFEKEGRQLEIINEKIRSAQPDVLLVALGAPKQELWMGAHVQNLPVGVAIGVGASLDFLAGAQRRAPKAVQAAGFEWLWRALSNPRRLGKRYALGLALLPVFVISHVWRHLFTKQGALRSQFLELSIERGRDHLASRAMQALRSGVPNAGDVLPSSGAAQGAAAIRGATGNLGLLCGAYPGLLAGACSEKAQSPGSVLTPDHPARDAPLSPGESLQPHGSTGSP